MAARSVYSEHLKTVTAQTEKALTHAADAGERFDGIVFHAGSETFYHADDHHVYFHTVPHFARYVPVRGPDHLLLFRPGKPLQLLQVVPEDFWHEPPASVDHPYANVVDVVRVATFKDAAQKLSGLGSCAYVGNDSSKAEALGIVNGGVEPPVLMRALDWFRAFKTPYEVECMREAARIAARGHAAVRRGFATNQNERALHNAYLEAIGMLEQETPYGNIIAWDRAAATLHYRSKSAAQPTPGHVLLIDAGACHLGYASDITRTYAKPAAPALFRDLLDRMEDMQRDLVSRVGPGVEYTALHAHTHRSLAELLQATGVLRVGADQAIERGLTRPFLPHGLGHHLGIQVHDVGGHQINPRGDRRPPDPLYPNLRTTRPLEAGHVITIEPGLYFIPMLLDPFRSSDNASAFNWGAIDTMIPCGGIRIEDDVLVTADGREDLTRPHVPGHRGT
jgi:Xaa-Pro dipeptidase